MEKSISTSSARNRDAVIQELLQAVVLLDNTLRYSSMADAYMGSSAQRQVQRAIENARNSFP